MRIGSGFDVHAFGADKPGAFGHRAAAAREIGRGADDANPQVTQLARPHA